MLVLRTDTLAARVTLLAAALALPACGTEEITIRVCGNVLVPDDIDALRIELLDEGLGRIRDGVLSLVPEDGDGPPVRLPVTVSLERGAGRGWVRVVGLKDQVAVVQFDRELVELADVGEADAVLTGACLRASCPAGQTCVASSCVAAPLEDGAPNCMDP